MNYDFVTKNACISEYSHHLYVCMNSVEVMAIILIGSLKIKKIYTEEWGRVVKLSSAQHSFPYPLHTQPRQRMGYLLESTTHQEPKSPQQPFASTTQKLCALNGEYQYSHNLHKQIRRKQIQITKNNGDPNT